MLMTKKGYVLLETVITLVCLIILIIPILKSVDLIEKDRMQLKENREILSIMEQITEEIEYSKTWNDAVKNRKIGEYEVVVNVAESYDENLYKFDIHISRDDMQKAQFFMIKRY